MAELTDPGKDVVKHGVRIIGPVNLVSTMAFQASQLYARNVLNFLLQVYDKQGADELVFLDITASHERRQIIIDVVHRTAQRIFMPLTVGGGISTTEEIRQEGALFNMFRGTTFGELGTSMALVLWPGYGPRSVGMHSGLLDPVHRAALGHAGALAHSRQDVATEADPVGTC